ncbi:MAG TPA: transglycosylase SLT domain-containing protein [Methyloradius sp.]
MLLEKQKRHLFFLALFVIAPSIIGLAACATHDDRLGTLREINDLSLETDKQSNSAQDNGIQNSAKQLPKPDTSHQTENLPPLNSGKSNKLSSRLQAGFGIASLNSNAVVDYTRFYGGHTDFILQALQKSAPYLPYIIDELEYRGMPTDLALLPIIESGFDPRATSSAAAAGIWQFIPSTGKRFGLQQTWLRDERRDPLTATTAALDYLQALYNQFGDWHLALASYNCGEGCVAGAQIKARQAGRRSDFISIASWLPVETQNYVPRFIAVRNIIAGTDLNRLLQTNNKAAITQVNFNEPVDLGTLSAVSGMPLTELKLLNAGILRQVVTANSNPIWISQEGLSRLKTALGKTDKPIQSLIRLKAAKAFPGESLSHFATRQNVSVEEVRSINGIHPTLSVIAAGTLFIPVKADELAFSGDESSLSPLRMVGEERLLKQNQYLSNSDKMLLAAHPTIIENSGWVPGRLKLVGNQNKSRGISGRYSSFHIDIASKK